MSTTRVGRCSGNSARATYPALGALLSLVAPLACSAATRDQIIIVGSSTVYPFSALVAEHFSRSGPFPAPALSATSTGEGFQLFCASATAGAPDITNASRPISTAERATCAQNGVRQIAALRIGYDSLVLAKSVASGGVNLTLSQLWRAAARKVPVNGQLVANPYRSWADIDPSLPQEPIALIGPSLGHGTRDAFVELVMEPSCTAALGDRVVAAEERQATCSAVRNDGHWSDVDNMELTLGKLASNPGATGILTYSYLEQFGNRIHAGTIDGVAPSSAAISSGAYPMSRPLFIYVNQAHLKSTTGLADFAAEFLSFCAAGAHGYLADEGLVPLPKAELLAQRAVVARLQR